MAQRNPDWQLPDLIDLREAEIARIASSPHDLAELRRHLEEIIREKAFKGSSRSAQFLRYVVEQALAGHFESLKERIIGIELFGRSPSYDTSEDAIVRVTASDVRKRLLQHYGENGVSSKIRISLPAGSYVPEITHLRQAEEIFQIRPEGSSTSPVDVRQPSSSGLVESKPGAGDEVGSRSPGFDIGQPHIRTRSRTRLALYAALVFLAVSLALAARYWYGSPRVHAMARPVLPWSAFFNSAHSTHLITSDPNIVTIQAITGSQISVSEYANRKYIPETNKLTPEELRICRIILWGDNSAAAIDPPIAVKISALAQRSSTHIDARAARSIQLSDLKNDDNFIFLGSPRSDPWSSLFSRQLDFRFEFDPATHQEIIRNAHPRANELPAYVPTAEGWATGRSYAIIAFIRNPDQSGQVLLVAGANGEGTAAAGKLVTDLPRLSTELARCGINSGDGTQHFELLLELNTLAGSPNGMDVVACHTLSSIATR
jgi:hypothetical protein